MKRAVLVIAALLTCTQLSGCIAFLAGAVIQQVGATQVANSKRDADRKALEERIKVLEAEKVSQ